MSSCLKIIIAAAILLLSTLAVPLAADQAAPPAAPEQPKAAFTLDGAITPGEYDGAMKIEFKVWNDSKATAYLINSGKYLIVAFDVPDMCTPVASASILIDGKADSNAELAPDDVWLKFAPEQVERPRCEQLRGGLGMWDEVDAKGWTGRSNMAMINRWQCEIVIDLDAFGVKYGKDAKMRCMLSVVSPLQKDVSADYPDAAAVAAAKKAANSVEPPQVDRASLPTVMEVADIKKPATWSLEIPLPGAEMPAFKAQFDAEAASAMLKKEAAAVVMLDDFITKVQDTQRQYTPTVQENLRAQQKAREAYTQAFTDGKNEEATAQLQKLAKLVREFNALLNERAQKLAALPTEADNIAKSLGEERTEVCDTQGTLYLNLFDLDRSSYTAERGAKCLEYFMKAFKLNPNIINNQKVRALMAIGCIREAEALVKARLALEPGNQEFRLLSAICDLRMGQYKESEKAIDALSKEKIEDGRLLPEIQQHLPWARAAVKLDEDEQARLAADAKANLPRVELDTTKGKIVIELFEDDAPNTVKNFIALVEQKFYDGQLFFRNEAWITQTGDPENCGMGTPGYFIKSEANNRKNFPGYVGMARFPQQDTEGCQFYFNRYYSPFRDDDGYTVFGRVVEGMDVLDKIERLDQIKTATVIRRREGTKYEPEKIERQ